MTSCEEACQFSDSGQPRTHERALDSGPHVDRQLGPGGLNTSGDDQLTRIAPRTNTDPRSSSGAGSGTGSVAEPRQVHVVMQLIHRDIAIAAAIRVPAAQTLDKGAGEHRWGTGVAGQWCRPRTRTPWRWTQSGPSARAPGTTPECPRSHPHVAACLARMRRCSSSPRTALPAENGTCSSLGGGTPPEARWRPAHPTPCRWSRGTAAQNHPSLRDRRRAPAVCPRASGWQRTVTARGEALARAGQAGVAPQSPRSQGPQAPRAKASASCEGARSLARPGSPYSAQATISALRTPATAPPTYPDSARRGDATELHRARIRSANSSSAAPPPAVLPSSRSSQVYLPPDVFKALAIAHEQSSGYGRPIASRPAPRRARAGRRGPRRRRPPHRPPALLTTTVTSAATAAASRESGPGDVECQRDDTGIVPGLRRPRGGVDLGRPALECLPDELGAEASVGAGDEHDPAGDAAGHRVTTILPLALPCST